MSAVFLGYGTMHVVAKAALEPGSIHNPRRVFRVDAVCGVVRLFYAYEGDPVVDAHPTCVTCAWMGVP